MKHPNQATLALHAGGDLGPFARWRTSRHLARCESCREEVAAFDEVRQSLPGLAEIPDLPWNRLAAEIKANVRLGLAAGECVRSADPPLRESALFTGGRAIVAFACAIVLVVTGMVLERPVPTAAREEGPLVQNTKYGIEVTAGGETLGLTNNGVQRVTYSLDAQGSIGARYTDPETGAVTINTVYVQ
jgi:anti-sigma factor RsiW